MPKQTQRRILRNYRNMPPSRFHALNQKIRKGLTDNPGIPENTWAANPTLLPSYLAASEKHDAAYHEAIYGGKLIISQREVLQAQIVNYLDEISLALEAAAVRNPEVLLSCGFDLAKDQRALPRAKPALTATEEENAGKNEHSSSG